MNADGLFPTKSAQVEAYVLHVASLLQRVPAYDPQKSCRIYIISTHMLSDNTNEPGD